MKNILIMKNMSIDKLFSVTLVTRREIKKILSLPFVEVGRTLVFIF